LGSPTTVSRLLERLVKGEVLIRRYRRAEAYEVLDGLLTTAIQKQQQVEKQLANFLEASPKLARAI
jgi:predicted transcriptional regulator